MMSIVKTSSVEVSQPRVSSGEMSSSNMFVIGSWDESDFEDSFESLSLSDSSEEFNLSDDEDSCAKPPSVSSYEYGQNSTVSFKSGPISVRSSKPVSAPTSQGFCDRYSSFADMKRDLTDKEIYSEFRSMSRKTYMSSDASLYGSSPPGIKS